MNFLGIDIGGTKVAVCLGNEKGEIIADRRFPTDPYNVRDTMAQAAQTMMDLISEAGLKPEQIETIGISAPAPLCSKNRLLMKTANLPGWETFTAGDFLEAKFKRPVFLQNDANGAGLAEFWFGGCKGKDLIYLTMSTGIGAGIIANGQLVAGPNDQAGEVGHMVLDITGPRCGCGMTGCWEAYCGGKNFADQVREEILAKGIQTSILKEAGGNPAKISMREICAAVRSGDGYASRKWDVFIEKMAHAVGILLMSFNPEAIVMGTIAIHDGDLFIPQMNRLLPRYAWQSSIDICRIEASVLKNIGELAALAVAIDGARRLNKG